MCQTRLPVRRAKLDPGAFNGSSVMIWHSLEVLVYGRTCRTRGDDQVTAHPFWNKTLPCNSLYYSCISSNVELDMRRTKPMQIGSRQIVKECVQPKATPHVSCLQNQRNVPQNTVRPSSPQCSHCINPISFCLPPNPPYHALPVIK